MNIALGYVLVFFGGGLGAAARHWVNRAALNALGPDYPAGTMIVNIAGSLAMGMLTAWFAFRGETTTAAGRLFLTTGVLGGFTTYSAFALETALLGFSLTGAMYVAATVVICLLAAVAGLKMGTFLVS